jgi:glycosyltransferase involved in cell wall biosynthesis
VRILFVADGRSPIARSWIRGVLAQGIEVHLATTYRCRQLEGLRSLAFAPVAFSRLKRGSSAGSPRAGGIGWRSTVRQWFGPATVPLAAQRLGPIVDQVQPDLIHALRIPFEGMLATWPVLSLPVAVSTWGNDFTLHAPSAPPMAWLTRRTMERVAGLHADCRRDLRLAGDWGLPSSATTVVLPGNGGLDPIFFADSLPPLPPDSPLTRILSSQRQEHPIVVNPRGFRAYVRNDTFFRSIPQVLAARPQVRFVCPAMAGDGLAEGWIDRLDVKDAVSLLQRLNPLEMAHLLRSSAIAVSPSEHDGTPNSLLEAMACGSFPIAGDLESLREWIDHGRNGLLIDPADPSALAGAILHVLDAPGLRREATDHNRRMARERAGRQHVMAEAISFYQAILERWEAS